MLPSLSDSTALAQPVLPALVDKATSDAYRGVEDSSNKGFWPFVEQINKSKELGGTLTVG